MKANQKFKHADDAVSPVIAVILMVAITVVLAATVYVWVSGFGAQSSTPAKTLSLTSGGALASSNKTYIVASATSGMKWSDVTITINGVTQTLQNVASCANPDQLATFAICTGSTTITTTSTVISAGQTLKIEAASGNTLRMVDSQANSVIMTLTVG